MITADEGQSLTNFDPLDPRWGTIYSRIIWMRGSVQITLVTREVFSTDTWGRDWFLHSIAVKADGALLLNIPLELPLDRIPVESWVDE